MQHPGFFFRAGPFQLHTIASAIGAKLAKESDGARPIEDVRPLKDAGPGHLSFFENRKYLSQLETTKAGACLLAPSDASRAPHATAILTAHAPYGAFARAMALFYSDALTSKAAAYAAGNQESLVHSTAQIAEDVVIEPGAVVGREAMIGAGSTISAGAVIGYRVVIGKDGYIGANSTITHAIIGDGAIIHAGVRIGQDGFGFAMGAKGHQKIPQIGRVIIGDNVEIGANTTIDRGSLLDTSIGSGTKIDNLVQIAHNVVIGCHCVIVAQSGIAGSSELGDFVVMGAHSGVLGHLKVGAGAQIASMAHVKNDVPAGVQMGGTPAVPFKEWAHQVAAVKRLGRKRP